MSINEEIGNRIKQRRTDLKMTQSELADKVGYTSYTSITKVEKGKVDLSQSKIYAFAHALDTSVEYIMGWDEIPVDAYMYNEKANQIQKKRMELHQMIDEAPEAQLNLLDILLNLSASQLEALAILTAQSRDVSEP